MIVMEILFLLLLVTLIFFGGFLLSVVRSLGSWNRTYVKLGKRYAGKQPHGGVFYGYLLSNPSLSFDYGRTYCYIKNRKTMKFNEGRQTGITMNWPNRKLKLEIKTPSARSRGWGKSMLKQVQIANPQFQADFSVASNNPLYAQKLLNNGSQWQLELLRRHTDNRQLVVTINRGQLSICKPGYIKDYQLLDDFLRYSLELFDQLMLVGAEGIEFLNENEAAIVAEVKCPICSEEIKNDMVVCARCKTPHCLDCWEYNGQCATFACSEARYVRVGSLNV